MNEKNKKMLVGAMMTLLGGIIYQGVRDVGILVYIVIGGLGIALIYDLYKKNKDKKYTLEQNVALISALVLAFFIVIFKASEEKIINLNIDFKVYMIGLFILLGSLILSIVVHAHKTQNKKEAQSINIIAGITIICVGLLVVMAFAWT